MTDAMACRLTVKLRLRDRHSAALNRQARAVNYVWNYCNDLTRKVWARDRRRLSAFELCRYTSGASKLLGLHAHTIAGACKQFAKAQSKAGRAGLRWRGRKSLGWVPFNTGHVAFDGAEMRFNGASYRPMHLNLRLAAGMRFGAGSFNQDSRGHWYINLPITVEAMPHRMGGAVGVDLGLKDLATLSDGMKIVTPAFYRKSEAAIALLQRARKAKRVRSIHAKIARRRKDFIHKASKDLASRFGLIVVGDVSPKKLSQTRMAKSVHDAGWSDFRQMLSYKAVMHGGSSLVVSERLTTQTCSECGSLPPSRPAGIAGLGIREWTCGDCGTVHDRDVNAARNILRVGLDTLAEGAARLSGAAKDAIGEIRHRPKGSGQALRRKMMEDDNEPRDLTLTEEVATLICIHENGIGTRELVEAQEGTDHQGEWQQAMKTAEIILDMLRTREEVEETIKRVIEKAFAEATSSPLSERP
jgi:putative transposase